LACSQTQDFQSPPAAADAPPPPTAPLAPPVCGAADDPNNCGGCHHSCLGGACASGVCQPVVLAEGQLDLYGGGPGAILVDGERVVWTVWDTVHRIATTGGAVENLGKHPIAPSEMRLDDGFIYFLDFAQDHVVRMPKDGGSIETVTPPLDKPEHLFPTIHRFEMRHGQLALDVKYGADTTAITPDRLFTCDAAPCATLRDRWPDHVSAPHAFGRGAIDLYVYEEWPDANGVVTAAGIECLGYTYDPILVHDTFDELVIEELPDHAYVYGASAGFVGRATLAFTPPGQTSPAGKPVKVLASDPDMSFANDLVLDGDFLYWIANSDSIRRVDKTGAALPEVVLDGWKAEHLAVGNDALYFTTKDGKVAKVARPAPKPGGQTLP
jgi:hypothetical protein